MNAKKLIKRPMLKIEGMKILISSKESENILFKNDHKFKSLPRNKLLNSVADSLKRRIVSYITIILVLNLSRVKYFNVEIYS